MRIRKIISALLCTMLLSACGTGVGNTAEKDTTAVTTEEDTETSTIETEAEQTSSVTETDDNVGNTTDKALDDEKTTVYNNIIDSFYNFIVSPDYDVLDDGMIGVSEKVSALGTAQTLDTIGYAVKDVNGDGVPELLVGFDSDEGEANTVMAMYTAVDNAPKFVFEGWSRNTYHLLSDGMVFNQGSGGAMYSIFGVYDISEDGTSLECKDYYFTYEKDDSFEEIGCYHNTTGEWDKSVSEEISEEDFWRISDELSARTISPYFTPFAEYAAEYEQAQVTAQWETVDFDCTNVCERYCAEGAEDNVAVMFSSQSDISDFKVLSLEFADADEYGKVNYNKSAVYTLDELPAGKYLAVNMIFNGDIPNNGIAYIDGMGIERCFAVEISGEDGSVALLEIK